jgi:hypothetical protein
LAWTDFSEVRIASIIWAMNRNSETSAYFNKTTQRYIPEGSELHTRRCENLKSFVVLVIYLQRIPAYCSKAITRHKQGTVYV